MQKPFCSKRKGKMPVRMRARTYFKFIAVFSRFWFVFSSLYFHSSVVCDLFWRQFIQSNKQLGMFRNSPSTIQARLSDFRCLFSRTTAEFGMWCGFVDFSMSFCKRDLIRMKFKSFSHFFTKSERCQLQHRNHTRHIIVISKFISM